MNRTRNRIKPEIRQDLYGFVKNTGRRNPIFMIRITPERERHTNADACVIYRLRKRI